MPTVRGGKATEKFGNPSSSISSAPLALDTPLIIKAIDHNNTKHSEVCIKCSNMLESNDNCICCYMCSRWYHAKCSSLTNAQYNSISKIGDCIEWFCPSCKHVKNENKNLNSILVNKIEAFSDRLDEFESGMDRICQNRNKLYRHQASDSEKIRQLSFSEIVKKKRLIGISKTLIVKER